MYMTKKIADRRDGFTLVEMLVVIAIILALAALAAAFMPRISDNQRMTRAVDNFEQWLLTAKMRARRDGLATGIRFIPMPGDIIDTNDPAQNRTYSQFQYIQQPPPLAGGVCVGAPPAPMPALPGVYQYPPPPGTGNYYTGGILVSAVQQPPASGIETVTFAGVDFSLGGVPQFDAYGRQQWLVQTGDYLEINGGGVFYIQSVVPPPVPGQPAVTLQLGGTQTYYSTLNIGAAATPPTPPVTNYRIIRQPRILIGEEPLALPNNYAVDTRVIPGPASSMPPVPLGAVIPGNWYLPTPPPPPPPYVPTSFLYWSNVAKGSSGYPEILFSPTGAVVGSNAGSGTIFISIYDLTMNPFDINNVGIVAVQCRTGFIGAYGAAAGAGLSLYNPFLLAQLGRESGM